MTLMPKKMRNNYWTTYGGYLLCSLLGHKHGGRFFERGNEFCDCGADHTYYGCLRCRTALGNPSIQEPKGPQDPRDPVGKNPSERPRKSSAKKRRQAETKLNKDLEGTKFEKKKGRKNT